jgi:dCTP deaminase
MILNDRAIRALCLVPTHSTWNGPDRERSLYAAVDGEFYSVNTGHHYSAEFMAEYGKNMKELTPEEQRGYATGGGLVPDPRWDNLTPEAAASLQEWGRMIYPFHPGQVRAVDDHEAMRIHGYGVKDIDTLKRYIDDPSRHDQIDLYKSALFTLEAFQRNPLKKKIISYGTSSMGYDVRLGRKFKIFTNVNGAVIDPLAMSEASYVDREGDFVLIPPNSYVLGHTIEYFRMPEDVVAICVGKSTYARAGCAINVTPIEPGFEGQVVIEIANQTPLPMKVYADMGIAQFMFFKGDACEISYAKRAGKYQGQLGITTARV